MFNAQGEPQRHHQPHRRRAGDQPGQPVLPLPQQGRHHRAAVPRYEERMDSALVAPEGRLPEPRGHLAAAAPGVRVHLGIPLPVPRPGRHPQPQPAPAHALRPHPQAGRRQCAPRSCAAWSQAGVMRASAAEIEGTATNILVLATFWLNYASVRGDKDEQEAIRQGIVQVMMLLAPVPARRGTRAPEHPDPGLPALRAGPDPLAGAGTRKYPSPCIASALRALYNSASFATRS